MLLNGICFGQDNTVKLKLEPPIKNKEVSLESPLNLPLKDSVNKPFYDSSKGKVADINLASPITTESIAPINYYQAPLIISHLNKNEAASEKVRNAINPFYIRIWWAWILLATLLTALFSWILMKKYYKTDIEKLVLDHINEHLDKKEFEKYRSINEIIEKIRHSESRIPSSAHELEVKKYERQIKESEEGLGQWLDIVDKKKPQEVKAFLLANGFYDNQVNPKSSNLQVAQSQIETIYFSDVNRGANHTGVFQEDNGSKSLKNDTLYKLEILKQSPQKANFYLIADEPNLANMLGSKSFKFDPFCTVLNDRSPSRRIITETSGTAELTGDKWIVTEKVKVRYV